MMVFFIANLLTSNKVQQFLLVQWAKINLCVPFFCYISIGPYFLIYQPRNQTEYSKSVAQ